MTKSKKFKLNCFPAWVWSVGILLEPEYRPLSIQQAVTNIRELVDYHK